MTDPGAWVASLERRELCAQEMPESDGGAVEVSEVDGGCSWGIRRL